MSIKLRVNGKEQSLEVDPEMPLLWAIRDILHQVPEKWLPVGSAQRHDHL